MEEVLYFVSSWMWIWLIAWVLFAFLTGREIGKFAGGKIDPNEEDLDLSLKDSVREIARTARANAERAMTLERMGKAQSTFFLFTNAVARATLALFVSGVVLRMAGY